MNSNLEKEFMAFANAISTTESKAIETHRTSLESKLEGPAGVISYLVPKVWVESSSQSVQTTQMEGQEEAVQGDVALSILIHLVEKHRAKYMPVSARQVRLYVEHHFDTETKESNKLQDDVSHVKARYLVVSDALLLALSKLLIASDDQVKTSMDAHAALLQLCRWDQCKISSGTNRTNASTTANAVNITKRTISTLTNLWNRLQNQPPQQQRQSSTSLMRIAGLMVDICLLGDEAMELCYDKNDTSDPAGNKTTVLGGLMQMALTYPSDDPLLQMSALDQLERLTDIENITSPISLHSHSLRADFLLGNVVLRKGLLLLIGDVGDEELWQEIDPINGGAALRLLSEICRVGIVTLGNVHEIRETNESTFINQEARNNFLILLQRFQKALHHIHPHGEVERLAFVYAISSLVSSCAAAAHAVNSQNSFSKLAKGIIQDKVLMDEWLSMITRSSQPKLKSAVLTSLAQVMEPSLWMDESMGTSNSTNSEDRANTNIITTSRPGDAIILQLYESICFANSNRDTIEIVLSSAKSPFIEERLGAYSLLRSLVMRGVTMRLLLLYKDNDSGGGFLEWLLQNENETSRDGRIGKYQIVNAMLSCNSGVIGGLVGRKAMDQLETWKRKGPNYNSGGISWDMAT